MLLVVVKNPAVLDCPWNATVFNFSIRMFDSRDCPRVPFVMRDLQNSRSHFFAYKMMVRYCGSKLPFDTHSLVISPLHYMSDESRPNRIKLRQVRVRIEIG